MADLFDTLRGEAPAEWAAYTRHPFVAAMADGTLPAPAFRHYLEQDYLFLLHFARAYGLAVYKARSLEEMRAGLEGLHAILDVELDLHVALSRNWGLTPNDLEAAPEAPATLAYTRYVLETGLRGDLLDLHVALSPCVIGYAEIAQAIKAERAIPDDHPYAAWINEYAGEAYAEVATAARATLDRLAGELMTEARYPRLETIFREACRLEADFWQMGWDARDEA
ncbi:MAG: thiaminase II [Pseudomonadota bacterium]